MEAVEIFYMLHENAWAALLVLSGQDNAWMLSPQSPLDAEDGLARLRALDILLESKGELALQPVYGLIARELAQAELMLRMETEEAVCWLLPSIRLPMLLERTDDGFIKVLPLESLACLFAAAEERVIEQDRVAVAALEAQGPVWQGELEPAAFIQWTKRFLQEGGNSGQWTQSS